MRNIWLIISREFTSRVRRPGFLWLTLAGPILIALFAIMAIQIGKGAESQKVLVVDEGVILNGSLQDSKWATYTYRQEDVSNAYIKKSKYDLILYINPKFATNNKVIIQYKERPSPYVVSEIIRQLEYRLERLKLHLEGIEEEAYSHIKQPVAFQVVNIDGIYAEYDQYSGYAGFVFGVIIFFFITMHGMQVLRGVIEEKTGRVVEIMVSSVSPIQLMAGKIVGIGLAAMFQFILWCTITFALLQVVRTSFYPDRYDPAHVAQGSNIQEYAVSGVEVNDVAEIIYSAINYPVMIGYFLFFFVFGYLLYASLCASLGAAVDNDSDSQQLMIPIMLPLILALIASWSLIEDPGSGAGMWGSIIPFTSPIVMMTRIATGIDSGDIWQLYLSMGALVAAFVLFTLISSRIYRAGILRYGRRARLKDLFTLMK